MELTPVQTVRLSVATALIAASGDHAVERADAIAAAVGDISEAVLFEKADASES